MVNPLRRAKIRLLVAGLCVCFAFSVVAMRLCWLASFGLDEETMKAGRPKPNALRAEITDRNGNVLATSIATVSVFADPALILNPKQTARQLAGVFTDLPEAEIYKKITAHNRFTWLKRHVHPKQLQAVNDLGLPGVEFMPESRRLYPNGTVASHVIGYTDVDGNGIAGLEKFFDPFLVQGKEPLKTSLDIRIQHMVKRELSAAIEDFSAIGGAAMVMDVRSGELLSMVSLPDFDSNRPGEASDEQKFNRNSLGVYEMGSTFKVFNHAMALDSGKVAITDVIDASRPIHIGRFTISDFKGKYRPLTVPEVIKFSSNIGSAHMALKAGVGTQKAFMEKIGMTKQASLELPETGWPLVPRPWHEINAMTVAFGHGISVSPVQLINGVASVVNGGRFLTPTLRYSPEDKRENLPAIIKPETSNMMRALMRLVVLEGSGQKANVPGYIVGGKTGTAEKVTGKHYGEGGRMSSFVGVFPINDPHYLVYMVVDEPKPNAKSAGYATGGWVAAPAVNRIIGEMAPMLGIEPFNDQDPQILQALSLGRLIPISSAAPPKLVKPKPKAAAQQLGEEKVATE